MKKVFVVFLVFAYLHCYLGCSTRYTILNTQTDNYNPDKIKEILLITAKGDTVSGEFLGFKDTNPKDYVHTYEEYRKINPTINIPAINDTVYLDTSKIAYLFRGFGFRSKLYFQSAKYETPREKNLVNIKILYLSDGTEYKAAALTTLIDKWKVPILQEVRIMRNDDSKIALYSSTEISELQWVESGLKRSAIQLGVIFLVSLGLVIFALPAIIGPIGI